MSEHDGGGAAHEECLVPQGDEPDDETEWCPFDEFHDEVEMPVVPKVLQADGMPGVSAAIYDDERSDIPPLSPETCVCMGVYTSFVLRDKWGDVQSELAPDKVERSPAGMYRARFDDVADNLKPGASIDARSDLVWIEVEPLRPPCKYYVRQLQPYKYNPKHKKAYRLCSARRTTEGTFMDVSDTGMFACDIREPPHPQSDRLLDDFDRKKIAEGSQRRYLPMFQGFKVVQPVRADADKDKDDGDDGPQGPGGIFGND